MKISDKKKNAISLPQEMIEAMIRANLPGRKLSVLLAIILKLKEANKEKEVLTYRQLSEMLCIDKTYVIYLVKGLEAQKIIERKKINQWTISYSIQENYSLWTEKKKGQR